jgi:LPXTG-motif cell wall-anchored protein
MKAFVIASCVGLFGATFAPALHADEWNKRTILTVNEPIQVPGKTLEPGQYVMKLLDSPSNRHVVQIYDKDEQHLITTVLAIPNYRLEPTGKTQFGFWETPAGQAKALRSWFYPGDNFGQEFAYPKGEAMQIAKEVNQPVPTTYATNESELTTARVGTVDQVGTEKEMEQQTPTGTAVAETPAPAEPPAQTAQNTPPAATEGVAERAATPAATPEPLPQTGSPYPLIALLGLASLFGAAVLSFASKKA